MVPGEQDCATPRSIDLLLATSATGYRGRCLRGRPDVLGSAQLRSVVRRAAITGAERRDVFGAASFRIVPRLQRSAFGVGARSHLVHIGSEVVVAPRLHPLAEQRSGVRTR